MKFAVFSDVIDEMTGHWGTKYTGVNKRKLVVALISRSALTVLIKIMYCCYDYVFGQLKIIQL